MAELESISVAPEHRGRGLGTRLMQAVHADLRERGIEFVAVTLFAGNEGAARLYERQGMRLGLQRMVGRVPPGDACRAEDRPLIGESPSRN